MEEPIPREAMPRGTPIWLVPLGVAGLLTLPFWQAPLLERLRLRTPDARRVAELTLTADRLAHQVDDLRARLREESEATEAARAEAAAATHAARAAQGRLSTLALIQLSAALRHSGRFETELAMVRAAGGPLDGLAPLLEQVRPYAAFGIPTLPQLRRDFDGLSGRLSRGGDALGRFAWAVGLIGLFHPLSASADAVALEGARVRGLLAQDDLAGALALARQMPESARGVLTDWLDDAAAREAAEILARRVAALAAQANGTPP